MTPRRNPFEELDRLFKTMSRQFEETGLGWGWEWGDREPVTRLSMGLESMAVDVVDRDDEFVVTVDLPGVDRDAVDVRVSDHRLTIAADQDEETEPDADAETYLRRERHHRELRRTIDLPTTVDEEAVTARMKNGVLTVTCPKTTVESGHEIEIE